VKRDVSHGPGSTFPRHGHRRRGYVVFRVARTGVLMLLFFVTLGSQIPGSLGSQIWRKNRAIVGAPTSLSPGASKRLGGRLERVAETLFSWNRSTFSDNKRPAATERLRPTTLWLRGRRK